MLLYTRKIQNSAHADLHTSFQMLLRDNPYLALLIQRTGATNYLLEQFFHYFIIF